MVKPLVLAGVVLLATIGACGSSGAPDGAVTDCGKIRYVGSSLLRGDTTAHDRAVCFVSAVHACHAARLELDFMGVDTGTADVLTVHRAEHHVCATAVAGTSSVLGRGDTHRHKVCRTAAIATDGVDLSDCR